MSPNILVILIFSLFSIPISSSLPHFFRNITNLPNRNFTPPWESFKNLSGCHLGDKLEGLAKVKQYFHQFGYLPDSLTNFTDDFDGSLESALKTYQLNFNLNDTGILDDSTLSRIALPRCGVADVINGSSTMKSGSGSGSSSNTTSSDIRAVAHYSFFPRQPRWPSWNRDLTYAFQPENLLTDSVKAVFGRAFARWAAVTPLTFTETDSFSRADITIGFFGGDHGDGEPFDGILGTLAHAFSPPDGRFHLDEEESWVVDGDVSTSSLGSAIDLESVAVHEIGHLLGLGHSSVEDAIMFPTISTGTRKTELATDDVEGIQVLYGANPNYNGSETTGSGSGTGTGTGSTNPSSEEREGNDGGVRLEGRFNWLIGIVMGCIVLML